MLPAPRPPTFFGRTTFRRCPVKDCLELATEQHHILYTVEHGKDETRDLCHAHHSWITRAQSHQGRKQRSPLSIAQRWRFWFILINGEMKRPRLTQLDREWESRWKIERGAKGPRV
jgi:hypothetical protein